MIKIGCVHGRFQPAHKDHLRYILEAKSRCKRLIIGITQINNVDLVDCAVNPHRSDKRSNPLSYRQRIEVIRLMLEEAGVPLSEIDFCPFPIDEPESLHQFIPLDVVCYTTIRDDWNVHKMDVLKAQGYEVIALWDSRHQETISATVIREKAANSDPEWRRLVTKSVENHLDAMDFEGMMRSVYITESLGVHGQ